MDCCHPSSCLPWCWFILFIKIILFIFSFKIIIWQIHIATYKDFNPLSLNLFKLSKQSIRTYIINLYYLIFNLEILEIAFLPLHLLNQPISFRSFRPLNNIFKHFRHIGNIPDFMHFKDLMSMMLQFLQKYFPHSLELQASNGSQILIKQNLKT